MQDAGGCSSRVGYVQMGCSTLMHRERVRACEVREGRVGANRCRRVSRPWQRARLDPSILQLHQLLYRVYHQLIVRRRRELNIVREQRADPICLVRRRESVFALFCVAKPARQAAFRRHIAKMT